MCTAVVSRSRLIRGEFTILNRAFDLTYADARSKQYRQLAQDLLSTVSIL